MSTFVVSARKYRPVRFDEVVGQEHVSGTLKKALQTDHLAHAFLFCGPRGVGKTTCARILAKVLNCQDPTDDAEPCNRCESCKAFSRQASFNITELDAASNNSVEHIRALIEQVRFQPQQGKYKVFIIDEVHMLSQQAFNAFLKTLEEPPPYAIFILATTEKHKILPTILSRCQIFDFHRIQVPQMVVHLFNICQQEGIEADPDALHIIGQKADGALRDALSIFDRIAAFSGEKITYDDVIRNLNVLDYDYYFRIVDALLTEDASEVLLIFDQILRKGFDAELFVNGLSEHLRNLLVCKDPETVSLLETSDNLRQRYQEQARLSPTSLLLTALNLANDCDINYKMARNKRLHVEICLLKMAHIGRAFTLADTPQAVETEASPEKKRPELSQADPVAEKTAKEAENPPKKPTETAAEPPSAEQEVETPTDEVDAPSTVESVAPPTAPEPVAATSAATPPANGKSRNGLKRSNRHGVSPLNMKAMLAEVEEDLDQRPQEIPELQVADVQKCWMEYVEQQETTMVKMLLKSVEVDLQGQEIVAKVGTKLAESAIRDETGLMDFLRDRLQHPELILRIVIDPSKAVEPPKRQKPLNAKEKYRLLNEVNPNVRTLITRFGLTPDEG